VTDRLLAEAQAIQHVLHAVANHTLRFGSYIAHFARCVLLTGCVGQDEPLRDLSIHLGHACDFRKPIFTDGCRDVGSMVISTLPGVWFGIDETGTAESVDGHRTK
jgi:hypothetical protein